MLVKAIWKFSAVMAVLTLMGTAAWAQEQAAQGEEQQAEASPWKDRAEYDMYDAMLKETDWAKKLELLNAWAEKYPETSFEDARLLLYVQCYQGLNDTDNLYDAAIKLVDAGPSSPQSLVQGLYVISSLTMSMANTDEEHLANGEKYSQQLIDVLATMEKPENVSEDQFDTQKQALLLTSHNTLGWVAMTRKDNVEAEEQFREVLKLNPNNGQASYWLGTVIIAQRDTDKQTEAFYHFARAASYTGEGAMPEAGREQVDAYIRKIYANYHGDESGLDDLYALAQKSAFPPADLEIKSKEQIAYEADEALKKENPRLYTWLQVKEQLTGSNGADYFMNSVRNTAFAQMRGYLISQSPEERPDTLVLGIEDKGTREVTLKLTDEAFKYPAARGTALLFQCVPQGFTADPFNVTFECEQAQVSGWPPPPSRRTQQ